MGISPGRCVHWLTVSYRRWLKNTIPCPSVRTHPDQWCEYGHAENDGDQAAVRPHKALRKKLRVYEASPFRALRNRAEMVLVSL